MPTFNSASILAERWIQQNRHNHLLLRQFLKAFPKGADLHSHASGDIYAEDYLYWGAKNGYCADRDSFSVVSQKECGSNSKIIPLETVIQDQSLYKQFIDAWSTRFSGGHDKFFDAFGLFGALPSKAGSLLSIPLARRIDNQVQYLEYMITFGGSELKKWSKDLEWHDDFDKQYRKVNEFMPDVLEAAKLELQDLKLGLKKQLGCQPVSSVGSKNGCELNIRFLQQINRTRDPQSVFSQFALAFALADQIDEIVGLNLVAPEDDDVALRDYSLHMKMVRFFRRLFPSVHVSLHAGELVPGLVDEKDLLFHIDEAVNIAEAERIGHGVDILGEKESQELLNIMSGREVLVEICLTSNEVILDVQNQGHPFNAYLKAGIPMALATDDAGISGIDLTHEFQLALERYRLSYEDLQNFAKQSLKYSFLNQKEKQYHLSELNQNLREFELLFKAKKIVPYRADLLGTQIGRNRSELMNTTKEIDALFGRGGNDTLNGSLANDNILNGGRDHDYIVAEGGSNTLVGGIGNDTIVAGEGKDLIVLSSKGGKDVIYNFDFKDDEMQLIGSGNSIHLEEHDDIIHVINKKDGKILAYLIDSNN